MEKTTVLAKLNLTLQFTEEALQWLQRFPDSWATRGEGSTFLVEFGHVWEKLFLDVADEEFHGYFAELGLPHERLPFVQVAERHQGSWILMAYLVMSGNVTTSYAVLKGVSELPQIAEGLLKVKSTIQKRMSSLLDRRARDQLILTLEIAKPKLELSIPVRKTPPPPQSDFMLDARPLLSLSPVVKSHKLHMSIGISLGADAGGRPYGNPKVKRGNIRGTKPVKNGRFMGLWHFVRARRATGYRFDPFNS